MQICESRETGYFIDNVRKSQRAFSLTAILITVGAICVLTVLIVPSLIRRDAPVPVQAAPRVIVDVSQRTAATAELQALAGNLEKYYNVSHKEDTANFQWRIVGVTSVVGTPSAGMMTRIGYIQGTATPTPPDGMVAPTGQRFLLTYEDNHWLLTGLKMQLSYMGALGDGDWRDVPCTSEELERIAAQKLGMRQQAL